MKLTRRSQVGCVALLLFVLGHAAIEGATPGTKKRVQTFTNLRTTDPHLLDLIDQAITRSSTLRDLVSRLEGLPVIAYLSRAALPQGLVGRTRLLGTGDIWRYISVEIDERMPPLEMLTVLGHELQHALEIAGASSVIDQASLQALYRRIGVDSGGGTGRAFETQEAVETGRRVHLELMGWAW